MNIFFRKKKRRSRFSNEQLCMQPQIREAVDAWVVRKGYTKRLPTVEAMSADIGIPTDQLSLHVRIRYRKSVLTWRKELRIREAQILLRQFPNVPISVIGEMVGIDDKTNFKRQFFQITGTMPRVWREKRR